jgi:hypothetical protein
MGRMAEWALRAEKRKTVKEDTILFYFFLCWEAVMNVCMKEVEKENENDKKEG